MTESPIQRLHLHGNALYNEGDFSGAIVFYTKALDLDPNLPDTRFNRALAYTQIHAYDEAICDLEIRIRSRQGLKDCYHLMAVVYRLKEDPVNSIRYLLKSITINPYDQKIVAELQHVLEFASRMDDTPAELEPIIEQIVNFPKRSVVILGYIYRSSVAARRYELNDAEQELNKALKVDPGNVTILEKLAKLYRSFSDWDSAEECYHKILSMLPKNVSAICRLGALKMDRIDYEAAEEYYQSAVNLDPHNSMALEGLGDVYQAIGDREQAKAYYHLALQSDKERPHAMYELASMVRNEEPELAIYLLKQIMKQYPDNNDAGEELDSLTAMYGDPETDFSYIFENRDFNSYLSEL